jgi:hypothetical protein
VNQFEGGIAMTASVEQKLPKELALAVAKAVYSYDGSLSRLSEEELLKLSDALAPHYPLNDEEEAAALTLHEWLTARQLNEDAVAPLKRLEDLAKSSVHEWRNVIDRWYHEREYRTERRYQEERHPELLYKELYYELQSGDPRSLIMVVERIVDEALRRNTPLAVGAPPQVQVPAELTAMAKELAKAMQKDLGKYIERVARAKQILSRYVHRIVTAENITRKKD